MKSIVAKKDFTLKGMLYKKGQELKQIDVETLISLNEKGFIEPIKISDLKKIKNKEIEKEKNENGTII